MSRHRRPKAFPLTPDQKLKARKAAQDGLRVEQIAQAINWLWSLEALSISLRRVRINPDTPQYLRGDDKSPRDRWHPNH
jgi:hypothetical protein